MKRIAALILALAVMVSFGVPAFADADPEWLKDAPANVKQAYYTLMDRWPRKPAKPVNEGYVNAFSWETDVFQESVLLTSSEVKIVAAQDAEDRLNTNELIEFLNAYEAARAASKAGIGKKLRGAYWYDVPERLYAHGDNYTKFAFTCTGRRVEATLDGEPLEIVHYTEGTSYYVKIPHNGILLIYSDPE